jgi:hypothetical protein
VKVRHAPACAVLGTLQCSLIQSIRRHDENNLQSSTPVSTFRFNPLGPYARRSCKVAKQKGLVAECCACLCCR